MNEDEITGRISDLLGYERSFTRAPSGQLYDAECNLIPNYLRLLGSHDTEVLLSCLERIDAWKKEV